MVVCRLVERCPLWHWGHWRETHCTGEWTHAPLDSTRPTDSQSSKTQKVYSSSQWSLPVIVPRGEKKEKRLSEKQLHERKENWLKEKKTKDEHKTRPTQKGKRTTRENEDEFQGKEKAVAEQCWRREMDKRSRCGGCINHRETFLHNPQVRRAGHQRTLSTNSRKIE